MKNIISIIIIYVCSIMDYILTYIGQNIYGVIKEVNPIMINYINDVPLSMGIIFRMWIMTILCLLIIYFDITRPNKWNGRIINTIAIIEVAVIIYHCTWIFAII